MVRRLTDQLLCPVKLVPLVGKADKPASELRAKNLFADLSRPGRLGQCLPIIGARLGQFTRFERYVAQHAFDDAGKDTVLDAETEGIACKETLSGRSAASRLPGINEQGGRVTTARVKRHLQRAG